jgi:hypothetical protein
MVSELTRRCVGLESRDDTRLSNLIRSAIVHIHCGEEKNITLLRDSGSDSFHDLSVDRLLIISNKILVEKFLDLVW